ncbi:hypothetical protein D3C84_1081970 [compost metagenome]
MGGGALEEVKGHVVVALRVTAGFGQLQQRLDLMVRHINFHLRLPFNFQCRFSIEAASRNLRVLRSSCLRYAARWAGRVVKQSFTTDLHHAHRPIRISGRRRTFRVRCCSGWLA